MESSIGDPHTVPKPAAPRVHPEPRCDHAEETPLTIPHQAHLQRDYTALGRTRQVTAAGEGHAGASGAADRTTDKRSAPGSGASVEAGTNTAGDRPALGEGTPGLRTLGGQRQTPQRPSGTSGGPRPGPMDPKAYRRGAARPGMPHLMAAYFAVPPPRGGHPHHGRHHLWSSAWHTPPATMDHPGQWHCVASGSWRIWGPTTRMK